MVADQRKGAEALLAAAGEVCARKKISEARARQVRWVAREYGRALEHPGHPLGVDAEVGELFQRRAVEAYLDLAGRGELRVRQSVKKVSGDRSRKARLEVLNLLAEALGVCADLPPQPDPAPKRTVSRRARSLLRTSLQEAADRTSLPGHIRMLAIGAVGTDTGARSGEHCACRIDDLAPSLEEIRIVRRPQGWKETESYVELIALSEVSRAALRRWLEEREVLLERVQGAATALWVSLRPNHRGERVIPPGTPWNRGACTAPGPGPSRRSTR
ncbi:hypothetical protein ACFQWA_27850 [Streptomyces thermogriseus]|uniref:hypothetical protein n=1 Tax=Streptomyces thermogriseus TaxID=75292 RepID=UPI0036210E86